MLSDARMIWADLGEDIKIEDRMSIFEEFYSTGNITESNDKDIKDYFIDLFSLSDDPVKHSMYFTVPLTLVNNKILKLAEPSYLEFLEETNNVMLFKNSKGEELSYPPKAIRERGIWYTFTFLTENSYEKFRLACVLKFGPGTVESINDPLSRIKELANIKK